MVVLGASLAALTAGALLARRGFRVAVIGHGARSERYTYEGFALRRGSSFAPWIEAPAFVRAMTELALLPMVRRRTQAREVAWQVCLPRHRLDVHVDLERRLGELDREFPEVHRPVEDFYTALTRNDAPLDRLFGPEASWPPAGFFERRALRRGMTDTPFGADGLGGDVFAEFAVDHPLRTVVDAQTRFAGAHDPDRMTALVRTRLHASGLRAAPFMDDGLDGLRRLLEERIQQHGGDVRGRERVERINTRRGHVTSVTLAGTEEEIGCAFVVTSLDAALAQRLTGVPATRAYAARLLAARPRYYRYTLNVVLPAEALPMGMGPRVFAVADLARPLAEENLLAIEYAAPDGEGRSVLTVVALLPRPAVEEGEVYMHKVRGRVLRALDAVVPFFDRHALVIDSPHDGLPLEDRTRAAPTALDARWSGAPEPMESLDERSADAFMGVCGLPMVGDIAGMFHVGRQVVPGLGGEGEFLAALTAAARITRTDRNKERMRREIWREG